MEPQRVNIHRPELVLEPVPRTPPAKTKPLTPERHSLQLTMTKETHDKLRRAQALLGHQISSGDISAVLDRALDVLIDKLEKRKLAATDKPRSSERPSDREPHRRYIPADVRRAVRKRDGDRCTFVSEAGHRCTEGRVLEFDHAEPLARGGESTVDGVRLRCRAHNQDAAECAFGLDFMKHKRQAAREAAARSRGDAEGRAAS